MFRPDKTDSILRVSWAYGLRIENMHDVTMATAVAICGPRFGGGLLGWGASSTLSHTAATDHQGRIFGKAPGPDVNELYIVTADAFPFDAMTKKQSYVLHGLLPPIKQTQCWLTPQSPRHPQDVCYTDDTCSRLKGLD